MAYQSVKTPRFYIDYGQYFKATGQLTWSGMFTADGKLIGLNPSSVQTFDSTGYQDWGDSYYNLPWTTSEQMRLNYCAWLGHNCRTVRASLGISTWDGSSYVNVSEYEVANFNAGSLLPEDLDGFSIGTFTGGEAGFSAFRPYVHPSYADGWDGSFLGNLKIGALSFGRYYNMPVSPDLSLTMSHEYKGISKTQSAGGSTYTNENWSKPPKWGDSEAWELPRPNYYNLNPDYEDWFYGGYRNSGRRSWDLSFSYISDTDLEPRNYTGLKPDGKTNDDNWFQNVLYYTMGGHLPFIFCPDPSIGWLAGMGITQPHQVPPRVPEFAICRFDMKSFKRKQVAHNTYNMKVKIKETW